MPTPEHCPICGRPWPDREHDMHERLADELAELYGPDFTPPRGEEGDAST